MSFNFNSNPFANSLILGTVEMEDYVEGGTVSLTASTNEKNPALWELSINDLKYGEQSVWHTEAVTSSFVETSAPFLYVPAKIWAEWKKIMTNRGFVCDTDE